MCARARQPGSERRELKDKRVCVGVLTVRRDRHVSVLTVYNGMFLFCILQMHNNIICYKDTLCV